MVNVLKYSVAYDESLFTQSFRHPGEVFLRHVCVWFDQVLYRHCSQSVDAGRHRAAIHKTKPHCLNRLCSIDTCKTRTSISLFAELNINSWWQEFS